MAGKADLGAAWADGAFDLLSRQVDAAIAALGRLETPLSDDAAVDRRARAINSLARAARSVAALTLRPAARAGGSAADATPEDRMSENDIDDTDPVELERLRAELQSRLDLLRSAFERKGMAVWPFPAPAAPGDPGAAGPS